MESNNVEEMEHVTALMVAALYGRADEAAKFCAERWNDAWMRGE
jgi:hypothetical protein